MAMNNIPISSEYIEFYKAAAKKDKMHKLIRRSTIGLFAALSFAAIASKIHVDDGFNYISNDIVYEYDKDTGLVGNPIEASLSEQYMEYADTEMSSEITQILDKLAPYVIARERYDDSVSVENPDMQKVRDARVDMVSKVNSLKEAATDIIRLQVIESLDLSNNADVRVVTNGNEEVGYEYSISVSDDGVDYTVSTTYEIDKLLETIHAINRYNGSGANDEAWTLKVTQEYANLADQAYYRILNDALANPDLKYKTTDSKAR